MNQRRDDFPKAVADALAKRAAFICSNPDCRSLTIAPSEADDSKFLYVGRAAHICAAAPEGPRYNAQMTPDERKSAANGIFLCGSCADMVDKNKGLDFPAECLQRWKEEHEKWVAANLNKRQFAQQQFVTYNVTSIGQQGGITAGQVNVGPQPRRIHDGYKAQLAQLLPDKSGMVTIETVLGDSEAFSFATQLKEHLTKEGHQVSGVDRVIFEGVVTGQAFNPTTRTITIGSRE